jgi:osmotically-inducible protein OsmY
MAREAALSTIIRNRLMSDKRVGDLPVGIYVIENVVYLIGRVDTLEQRDIVEFIVRGAPGVRRVNTDELAVSEISQATAGK